MIKQKTSKGHAVEEIICFFPLWLRHLSTLRNPTCSPTAKKLPSEAQLWPKDNGWEWQRWLWQHGGAAAGSAALPCCSTAHAAAPCEGTHVVPSRCCFLGVCSSGTAGTHICKPLHPATTRRSDREAHENSERAFTHSYNTRDNSSGDQPGH